MIFISYHSILNRLTFLLWVPHSVDLGFLIVHDAKFSLCELQWSWWLAFLWRSLVKTLIVASLGAAMLFLEHVPPFTIVEALRVIIIEFFGLWQRRVIFVFVHESGEASRYNLFRNRLATSQSPPQLVMLLLLIPLLLLLLWLLLDRN